MSPDEQEPQETQCQRPALTSLGYSIETFENFGRRHGGKGSTGCECFLSRDARVSYLFPAIDF